MYCTRTGLKKGQLSQKPPPIIRLFMGPQSEQQLLTLSVQDQAFLQKCISASAPLQSNKYGHSQY